MHETCVIRLHVEGNEVLLQRETADNVISLFNRKNLTLTVWH